MELFVLAAVLQVGGDRGADLFGDGHVVHPGNRLQFRCLLLGQKAASKVLRDGRTGKASKTAAASALSQRAPKRKG